MNTYTTRSRTILSVLIGSVLLQANPTSRIAKSFSAPWACFQTPISINSSRQYLSRPWLLMKLVRLRWGTTFPFSQISSTVSVSCVSLGITNSVGFTQLIFLQEISYCFSVPPFGQEDLQDLQSIFEIPHLQKHVVFLDTQCELYYVQNMKINHN